MVSTPPWARSPGEFGKDSLHRLTGDVEGHHRRGAVVVFERGQGRDDRRGVLGMEYVKHRPACLRVHIGARQDSTPVPLRNKTDCLP